MKKTLMILGLLSILTTNISAGGFYALSYGQGLEDKTFIDEQGNSLNFQNLQSVHFKLGTNHFPIEEQSSPIGVYFDIALGRSDPAYYTLENKGEKLQYENMLANIGLTYSLNNYFVLFGGIGANNSKATVKNEGKDTHYYSHVSETKFNVNTGLMIYLYKTRFGLMVDYNSVPKIVSAGLTYRF